LAAIAVPKVSVAPVVIVPVYLIKGNSGTVGVNVNTALFAVGATVPAITVAPCIMVNVVPLIVEARMAVLKVIEITLLSTTSTATFIGSVETTTGQTPWIAPLYVSFLHPAVNTAHSKIRDSIKGKFLK